MPLFKVWDVTRTKKKSVMANNIQELVMKGKTKLDLREEIVNIFEEDGTEIDDDECLLAHEAGAVFILGRNFNPDSAMTKPDTIIKSELIKTEPKSSGIGCIKRTCERASTGFCDDNTNHIDAEPSCKKPASSLPANLNTKKEMPNAKSGVDLLMKTPFRNAKLRNIKIYSVKEIESAKSPLESQRRKFWNEKAEQLATKSETCKLDKTTIGGIIDVSWTLRKTSLIEVDTRKVLHDEKIITGETSSLKTGSQKRQTIPHNLDRMEKAHVEVESLDKEMTEIRRIYEQAKLKSEKVAHKQKYEGKKKMLDGAYTELKKAQEALTKALLGKKKELEKLLHSDKSEN